MLKDLLKHLEILVQNGASLKEGCPKDLLQQVIASKDCQKAVKTLLDVSPEEGLPSLIGRGKNIIELHLDDTWQVSLVRQALFGVDPFLVSTPNPVLGCCVGGEGKSELSIYRIKGDTRALSMAGDWELELDHTEDIKVGDLFSCSDPDLILDFRTLSPTHIFLRFAHKPIVPHLFVFERESKKFSYHTFADEIATGHLFFADLIYCMAGNPDCTSQFSDTQRRDILNFCDAQIGSEAINMKARWRLLQALGLADEKRAVAWLERFSDHPDPGVSRLAAATLSQLAGREG